jgi:hypothetical protein
MLAEEILWVSRTKPIEMNLEQQESIEDNADYKIMNIIANKYHELTNTIKTN